MTDARKAMEQALQALEQLDGIDTETECVTIDVGATIEALREALAQQSELWNASRSEQLLASYDHAVRAEFQRTKAALAQQGEPVAWMDLHKELGQLKWAGRDEGWDMAIRAVQKRLVELDYAGAAPAAQPDARSQDFRDGYEKGKAGFMEAVALEREECAKVVEPMDCAMRCGVGGELATAIRARGNHVPDC